MLTGSWPGAGASSAAGCSAAAFGDAVGEAVEGEVDDGRRVERQELGKDESSDDRDAEGPPQLGPDSGAQRERHAGEQRRHRRHQDRAQAQEARLVDRVGRLLLLLALGVEREVDHHDRVLLDDPDEQDDADERDDGEVRPADHQREKRPHRGGGERREDRDRMDVALVQHAEQDVDRDDGRQDQEDLVGQRRPERLGGPLEARLDARRHSQLLLGPLDRADRLPERRAGREVEGEGDDRELSLVVHGEGSVGCLQLRERAERHRAAARRSAGRRFSSPPGGPGSPAASRARRGTGSAA